VNNVRLACSKRTSSKITDATSAQAIDVNLKGPFIATQEAARHFRTVSAAAAEHRLDRRPFGGPKAPHYSAAKSRPDHLPHARTARLLGALHVRVNAIRNPASCAPR